MPLAVAVEFDRASAFLPALAAALSSAPSPCGNRDDAISCTGERRPWPSRPRLPPVTMPTLRKRDVQTGSQAHQLAGAAHPKAGTKRNCAGTL